MMLLATVVVVVLSSAAATTLAASPSDGDSANNGTLLSRGDLGKNKDFSGLVDIGGGRKMYMECHGKGKGSPTVVLISGTRGSHRRAHIRHSRLIRRLDKRDRLQR